jgi:hypothetical protein
MKTTLKKLDERKVRVLHTCDCGISWAHDIEADSKGIMTVETILLKGKKANDTDRTKAKSIFDSFDDEDEPTPGDND